jgi:hypothetical protein
MNLRQDSTMAIVMLNGKYFRLHAEELLGDFGKSEGYVPLYCEISVIPFTFAREEPVAPAPGFIPGTTFKTPGEAIEFARKFVTINQQAKEANRYPAIGDKILEPETGEKGQVVRPPAGKSTNPGGFYVRFEDGEIREISPDEFVYLP